MTRVKFCGVMREEDVRVAVRLGVDYLGLNFVTSSPRCLRLSRAVSLAAAARTEAARLGVAPPALVGVFASQPVAQVQMTIAQCGLVLAQMHGVCAPRDLNGLSVPTLLAVRPRPGELVDLGNLPDTWAYVVDAYHDQLLGGTGTLAEWGAAARLAAIKRVFLAGGLRPGTVGRAVAATRPYAVDVASGIEAAPGVKDPRLMQAFIEEVREADARERNVA